MRNRIGTVIAVGVAGLLAASLAGCSSSDSSSDSPAQDSSVPAASAAPSSSASVGTNWKFIPIQSDNVAEAGYDVATFTLIVKFKKGAVYSYSPVPPAIWQQFQDAQPDPWSKVGKPYLVDGGVPYHQLQ